MSTSLRPNKKESPVSGLHISISIFFFFFFFFFGGGGGGGLWNDVQLQQKFQDWFGILPCCVLNNFFQCCNQVIFSQVKSQVKFSQVESSLKTNFLKSSMEEGNFHVPPQARSVPLGAPPGTPHSEFWEKIGPHMRLQDTKYSCIAHHCTLTQDEGPELYQ